VTLAHRGTAGEREVEIALDGIVPPGIKATVRLLAAQELKPDSPCDEQVRQLMPAGGKVSLVLPRYSIARVSISPP
jgi:hypothetical protein